MRGEAGISVSDNFTGGTIVWENMLNIKVSNGGGSGCFVAGNENSGFRAVMVCDSEDAVKPLESGSLTMRSMAMVSNGRAVRSVVMGQCGMRGQEVLALVA